MNKGLSRAESWRPCHWINLKFFMHVADKVGLFVGGCIGLGDLAFQEPMEKRTPNFRPDCLLTLK